MDEPQAFPENGVNQMRSSPANASINIMNPVALEKFGDKIRRFHFQDLLQHIQFK
jgi:hypothetical protein